MSPKKYVLELLKETEMLGCKLIATSIKLNHKLGEADDDVVVDRGMYQRLVGKLIYLSHIQLDISLCCERY